MSESLRADLTALAMKRTLYWKHRKTSMIAKSVTVTLTEDRELLIVKVNRVPLVVEDVPRARMEKSFILITRETYAVLMKDVAAIAGESWTVDLESGRATATVKVDA